MACGLLYELAPVREDKGLGDMLVWFRYAINEVAEYYLLTVVSKSQPVKADLGRRLPFCHLQLRAKSLASSLLSPGTAAQIECSPLDMVEAAHR